MRVLAILVILAIVSLSLLPASPAAAVQFDGPDWSVAGGHFFTQTGDGTGRGYGVFDDETAKMEREFYRLGGESELGYPISERYVTNGVVYQAFQRAILRWSPELERVEYVSILNEASAAKHDPLLFNSYKIPRPADWTADARRQWPEVVAAHQAKLNADPIMKEFYFSVPDPLEIYGLPMSDVTDIGPVVMLRTEKTVFQRWKQDQPYAKAGSVTLVLTGEIAKQLGMIPAESIKSVAPEDARGGERWIEVVLSGQDLNAYQGLKLLYTTKVSTGVPGMETPIGDFRIYNRVANETMDSQTIGIPRDAPDGYHLTNVLFTQYFAPGGVALHYNYWTPDYMFGNRAGSHGCVGMRYDDALYFWEFGERGMRVLVRP